MKMGMQERKYRTQWSAQFFTAGELARRGYLVSLTLGNAPVADLLVQSPSGTHFTVDVKGQSTKNFWLIQKREPNPAHFFVLVYLPSDLGPPRYFIVPSDELMRRREEYRTRIISKGARYRDELGGINWSTASQYENNWGCLPT
ncbi:MAG: hypothetical protein ACOY3F_08090 [Bacillota bacterium]